MVDTFKEDLLSDFVLESREHLETVEPNLLEIEENLNDIPMNFINEVFRAIHSLKGSAAFFGFDNIKSLAHVMENLLMKVRDGELSLDSDQISILISGTDKLRIMIDDLQNCENVDVSEEVSKLEKFLSAKKTDTVDNSSKEDISTTIEKVATPVKMATSSEDEILEAISNSSNNLYNVTYSLGRHVYDKNSSIEDVQILLSSVGIILYTDKDTNSLPPKESPKSKEETIIFAIATVLQAEYLVDGLEIEESQIKPLKKEDSLNGYNKAQSNKSMQNEIESKSKSEHKASSQKKDLSNPDVAETLRVPVSILNKLMDLAGELVLNRNQLKQLSEKISKNINGLPQIMQSIDLVTSDLQSTIMNARLQPIGVLFNKFPRVIRDLAKQLDKEIDLVIEGKDVDMDKSIIETLSDPLTHLIRNCADHGIETPKTRINNGKPSKGIVILKAYHKSGQVFIDIIDDGKGIDTEVIKKKVLEKELMTSDKLKSLSDKEIMKLIFLPGFSTNTDVTEVSGRGVGMDVVRTNIEKLGGSIDLESTLGEGSKVTLRLPLTLAIIPSQIIDVSGVRYAVPQVNLDEMLQVGGANSKYNIEQVNGKEILRLRGELLPLVDLDQLLIRNSKVVLAKVLEEEQTEDPSKNKKRNILVLSAGTNKFGLIVSNLLDSEEIVVKPLSDYVKVCKYYAGATILGDGQIAMILDVAGISDTANLDFHNKVEDANSLKHRDNSNTETKASFLVIENSKDDYFAVPLQFVARVDRIRTKDLVNIDGNLFFKHQDELTRLIWLSDFVNTNKVQMDSEYIFVIIPKVVPHPIGICATNIHDVIETAIELNTDNHSTKGILGSALVNNKPILFLELFELFENVAPELYKNNYLQNPTTQNNLIIAENNPIHMSMLKKYFESTGVQPHFVSNGLDVFKKIQNITFEKVLTAKNLPIMNTETLITQSKTFETCSTTKFISLLNLKLHHEDDCNSQFDSSILKFDKYQLLKETLSASSQEEMEVA